jgi:hypothetical protein
MAGTALACTALLAWKDVDARGVQSALDRAWPYLNDEKNMALDDADEIIWGYAYRISYFARLAAADAARKDACLAKMKELVAAVAKLQKRTGIWRHEYDAPFTTATVLHALWEAKQAGVDVPDAAVDKALDALASCRTDKGVFSYGYPPRGATAVQGSAGRMPLCELALFLSRRSKQADLHAAAEKCASTTTTRTVTRTAGSSSGMTWPAAPRRSAGCSRTATRSSRSSGTWCCRSRRSTVASWTRTSSGRRTGPRWG